MAESEKKSLNIPWPPLLALLAAVLGLAALLPSPSARPTAAGGGERALAGGSQEVSARLWQDPLSVARDAWVVARNAQAEAARRGGEPISTTESPACSNELAEAYQKLDRGEANTLVLVACVPASPYAEDVERRLRDRVGVVQALAAEGYLPERSTRLRYACVRCPGTTGAKEDWLLPYEGFLPLAGRGPGRPPVLLVWLADGTLGDNPLVQFAELSRLLDEPDLGMRPAKLVLGPANSLQYRRMLEAAGQLTQERARVITKTWVYSCKASAAEEVLSTNVPWLTPERLRQAEASVNLHAEEQPKEATAVALTQRVQNLGGGLSVNRTICDDGQLAAVLWAELKQREIKPEEPVAAIAELDSFFGRASTLAFLHARPTSLPPVCPLDLAEAQSVAPNVRTFAYLAGTDGALPKNAFGAGDGAGKESAGPASKSSAGAAVGASEPSEGGGQVDYLRRLADELAAEDRWLNVWGVEKKAGGRAIRAVAVLGSDTYDKLQILHTLRPRLPAALFLTLGLEARFQLAEEWPVTRNLLAASNYPLRLPLAATDRRQDALPFRDSGQAAIYSAARYALQTEIRGYADKQRWLGRPRLFEIGRHGPVPLPSEGRSDPEIQDTAPPWGVAWWFCILCGLCVLGLAWLLRVGGTPSDSRRWYERSGRMVPVVFVVGLTLTVCRYYWWNHPALAEPFAPLNGMSIWPGDFLRTCVVLLALHFSVKLLARLQSTREELQEDFALASTGSSERDDPDGGALRPRWWRELWSDLDARLAIPPFRGGLRQVRRRKPACWLRWWTEFWPQAQNYHDDKGQVQVWKWWHQYGTWGMTWKRVLRATLLTAFYVAIILSGMEAFHALCPDLPVRGSAAWGSRVLLWSAGLLSLFVTFLVVDATELNWRSIRDLNSGPTDWQGASGPSKCSPEVPVPGQSCFEFVQYRKLLDPEDFADYLDIELIARRSDVVNDFVYYPFVLLTLIVVSYWMMTDNYAWTPALLVAFGANAAVLLYCAIRLPMEANRARDKSLRRLRDKLYTRLCAEACTNQLPAASSVAALEGVIAQIEGMRRGAFVGIWEQPALRAVLVPSGGAGLWKLWGLLPF